MMHAAGIASADSAEVLPTVGSLALQRIL